MNAMRFLLLFVLIALATGCGGAMRGKGQAAAPAPPPFTIQPLHRVAMQEKDLPDDAKLVIGAIVSRMALQTSLPSAVVFDPGGSHQIHDDNFDYAGFGLRGFDLLKYDATPSGKKSARVELSGVVHLKDPLDRLASVTIITAYEVTRGKVKILESSAQPIQPAFPRILCFFVPETAIKGAPKGSLTSFLDWYAFAAANSVNMTPTQSDRDERAKWESKSFFEKATGSGAKKQRYIILAFAMNRILEPGSLSMGFCDSADGALKNQDKATFLNFGGWRIGTMGAEFAINDFGKEYFVQVRYTPDTQGTAGSPYPVLVGLFSTLKNYNASNRVAAQVSTQTGQPGMIESGKRFLNPKNKQDAKVIQSRLAELGFYTSTVDGAFGKGSRAALGQFKATNGLGEDTNWDMPTQQALFSGTGQ
jgi:hypothetical protein